MSRTDHHPKRPTRVWLMAILSLLAVGVGVSVYLTDLFLDLHFGPGVADALCDWGGDFRCTEVAASPWAAIAGIPQALLAIPTYLLLMGLAAWGWSRRSQGALGWLLWISFATVVYAAWLAFVSHFLIGAWCVFCMVLYGVNLGTAGLALNAAWPSGYLEPLRAWKIGLAAGLAFGLLFAASWMGYEGARQAVANGVAELAAGSQLTEDSHPESEATSDEQGGSAQNDGGEADDDASRSSQTRRVRLPEQRAELALFPGLPALGSADAPVTVVEFSDFLCPFCKRLADSLHQLVVERPEDVRLVFVQYPLDLDCNQAKLPRSLHPGACLASAAAVCAGQQDLFWEMHDALFESRRNTSRKGILSAAEGIGLQRAAFEICLDDPATLEDIGRQTEIGAPLRVTGTPVLFVNGRRLSGAQPIEVLRAVVDAELAGTDGALDLEVEIGTEITGKVPETVSAVRVGLLKTAFEIDAFEASLSAETAQSVPGVSPAASSSWFEAAEACTRAGKRLCTEAEWLAACTGAAPVDVDGDGAFSDDPILGAAYGYGDRRLSGVCSDSLDPALAGDYFTGNHPRCGTPSGAWDMVGGLKEWVGLTPSTAVVKGGSWASGSSARCGYHRDDIPPASRDETIGFRCCRGPAEAPESRPGRDVDEQLTDIRLPLLDGGDLDMEALHGHPLVLAFWASWCAPCKTELKHLGELYERYTDHGLRIIAVSVDEDEDRLRAWLQRQPLPFPVARDPGGELMTQFTSRGVPTTVWRQADGMIWLHTTGVPPGGERRLAELVRGLMGIEEETEEADTL